MSGALRTLLTLALLLAAPLALAADPLSIPAITLSNTADGQQEYSVSLQILLIMTALSCCHQECARARRPFAPAAAGVALTVPPLRQVR